MWIKHTYPDIITWKEKVKFIYVWLIFAQSTDLVHVGIPSQK